MVLKLRIPPPDDWQDAKCLDIPLTADYDPFFGVEYDQGGFEVDEDEAKSHAADFCNGVTDGVICPIRHECLIFALVNNCKEGVWGGTTEITRKALRKKYPANRNGKPNENWRWTTESEVMLSLKGLNISLDEEDEDEDI